MQSTEVTDTWHENKGLKWMSHLNLVWPFHKVCLLEHFSLREVSFKHQSHLFKADKTKSLRWTKARYYIVLILEIFQPSVQTVESLSIIDHILKLFALANVISSAIRLTYLFLYVTWHKQEILAIPRNMNMCIIMI